MYKHDKTFHQSFVEPHLELYSLTVVVDRENKHIGNDLVEVAQILFHIYKNVLLWLSYIVRQV